MSVSNTTLSYRISHIPRPQTILPACISNATQHHSNQLEEIIFDLTTELNMNSASYIRWLNNKPFSDSFNLSISNTPENWQYQYQHNQFYALDPIIRVIEENSSEKLLYGRLLTAIHNAIDNPVGKTDKEKNKYRSNLIDMVHCASTLGINDAYYMSTSDETISSLIIVTSAHDLNAELPAEIINKLWAVLALAEPQIRKFQQCQQCYKKVQKPSGKQLRLTKAENTVLKLFLNNGNASLKEIASYYNSEIVTVNHHLKSLRRKFEIHGASGYLMAQQAKTLGLI